MLGILNSEGYYTYVVPTGEITILISFTENAQGLVQIMRPASFRVIFVQYTFLFLIDWHSEADFEDFHIFRSNWLSQSQADVVSTVFKGVKEFITHSAAACRTALGRYILEGSSLQPNIGYFSRG